MIILANLAFHIKKNIYGKARFFYVKLVQMKRFLLNSLPLKGEGKC